MSNPIQRLLDALRKNGHEPRKSGAGWCCTCPAHDDSNPSLSIHAGDDGRALVNCHVGCTVDAVCGAVGLRLADLFADDMSRQNGHSPKTGRRCDGDETPRNSGSRGSFVAVAGVTRGNDDDRRTFKTAREAVECLERRSGRRSAMWTYHDADGESVGVVLRWDKPGGGKSILPVSRTPRGWIVGGMPEPRPLYRLPDLLAGGPGVRVCVFEGEKAADAARTLEMVATTSPHGSKSAGKADWSALAGRQVVIFPDHDKPGEKYADDVARLATAAGAKSVRIVRLVELWADLPEGGDMADLVARAGGDLDALGTLAAEVESMAEAAVPPRTKPAPAGDGYRPFPVGVLPEPARSFVTEAATAIGCDAAYLALPLVSALASAVGNTRVMTIKRGWDEPAIVWTAIVGESGTAKSPAMEAALRPIRERQHAAMERHADEVAEFEAAAATYNRDAGHWNREKGDRPPPAKPEAPKPDRCWTDDATTEALAVLLQQNPRGLLMVRDELAGWFNFDRYAGGKGGDAAKWLEMYGGRPMMVDRKGGGTLHVPRASVSITGGIQPATLRRALGREHRDNGLAARLLLAFPPFRPALWTEAEVDPRTDAAVSMAFDRLFLLLLGGDGKPVSLGMDEAAKAEWVRFHDEHAAEQGRLSGDDAAAWAKLKGYAARLALVLHLARWAGGDAAADPGRLDVASVRAGVELTLWFGHEARRVYGMLAESDEDGAARRLTEWIERQGRIASVRDVTRGPSEYRGKPEAAAAALADLVTRGVAAWDHDGPGPKGGRPPERVRLVRREVDDSGDGDETG